MEVDEEEGERDTPPAPSHVVGLRSRGGDAGEGVRVAGVRGEGGVTPELRGSQVAAQLGMVRHSRGYRMLLGRRMLTYADVC